MRQGELDHVGVVVADLDESVQIYERLGFRVLDRERVEEQGVDIIFMGTGEGSVELLKPLAPDSPLRRFLGDQRSRLHHLAYCVDDLPAELARLKSAGVPLIDEAPRRGSGGRSIAFIHPKYSGGTLIELCQPPRDFVTE